MMHVLSRGCWLLIATCLPFSLMVLLTWGWPRSEPINHVIPTAVVIIDTLIDENDGDCYDGDCSLRDAIQTAAANDSLQFSLSGTIELSPTFGQLIVDKNLTIKGTTPITISGSDMVRLFKVITTTSPTIQVTFSHLTLTHGSHQDTDCGAFPAHCGGAIYVGIGTAVTVTHSTLINNQADYGGAIFVNGTGGVAALTINNSTFSNNLADIDGGGIYNYGYGLMGGAALTISQSTLFSNTAASNGGGIFNYGSYGHANLFITDTTLSHNTAQTDGGGIYNRADFAGTAPITLYNSTLSTNMAANGGGLFNIASDGLTTVTLQNSTFSHNTALTSSGGIHNIMGILNVTNTLVANSMGGDCFTTLPLNRSRHNLVEDGSCITVGLDGNLDGDPLLDVLAYDGGSTQTHALLRGSPAIDTGTNLHCLVTDQRGVKRPLDGDGDGDAVCDIGAFEAKQLVYLPIIFNNQVPILRQKFFK